MVVRAELAAVTRNYAGRVGLWARSLTTGETLEFGAARESFPSASVIKLAVLYELFHQTDEGRISLGRRIALQEADKVPGSGVLKDLSPGLRLTVLDLATLMMTVSDNTASNLCIDLVGLEAVTARMAALGLPGLQLHNQFYRAVPGRPGNQAVPADLGRLMDRIGRHELLTPAACDQMLGIMERVQGPFVPRFLPEFLQQPAGAPAEQTPVRIAAKSGAIMGCRHEVALVRKGQAGYVIAVMTGECPDLRYHEDNQGQILVGQLAAVVHRYFTAVTC